MAVTDISELRKQQKKKRTVKVLIKVFMLLLLIGVVIIAVITRDSWIPSFEGILTKLPTSDTSSTELSGGNFPISIDGGSDYQMSSMGDAIGLLDESKFHVYSTAGKVMYERQHTYANPILETNSSKALIYDLGGTNFSLEGKYKNVYEKTSDDVILRAELSDNDYVAVVTKSENLLSMLRVYDAKGNEVFRYSSYDGRIIDVSFNSDSTACILTIIAAENGELLSKMISFNFDDTAVQWQSDGVAAVALDTCYMSNGSILMICDTMTVIYNSTGELISTYEYPDSIIDYGSYGDYAAILVSNTSTRVTKLIIITESNIDDPTTVSVDYNTEKVYCTDKQSHILNSSGVYTYDLNGNLIAYALLEDEYDGICKIKEYMYLLGYDSVNCIEYAS